MEAVVWKKILKFKFIVVALKFSTSITGINCSINFNIIYLSFRKLQEAYFNSFNFPFQHAIFDWSESTQGLILSGFYYGYAITHVPGGYLAEKYGGKWTLGIGLLSTAVFTLLTPVVVKAGGATWLFILRILQGMGEVSARYFLMV